MSADLKTAASAVPKTLVSQSLAAADTVLYTAAAGTSVKLSKIRVTNADGSARNVTLTIVKSGGTSGATNKIMSAESVAAGVRVDLGSGDWLGEGDFISGFAPSSTNVDIVISGIEFGGGTGSALTGIQDDAVGSGARATTTGTITTTNTVGTAANRYQLAAMVVGHVSASGSYSTYATLDMSNNDGAMTRLVSVDFNVSGSITGSIHLFGRANPTSNTTHTLTGHATKASSTFNLFMASMSLSGVASVTGAATVGPSSSVVPTLAVTSAVGHRPFWAFGFNAVPQDFNRRYRYFNWDSYGTTAPHYFLFADAIGASSVTASTLSADFHAGVGIDLVPA